MRLVDIDAEIKARKQKIDETNEIIEVIMASEDLECPHTVSKIHELKLGVKKLKEEVYYLGYMVQSCNVTDFVAALEQEIKGTEDTQVGLGKRMAYRNAIKIIKNEEGR